ncbi:MAG: hypothetical protein K6U74_02005 [Firmicutes bacterium]|nr:hypothetical protein [Bacillota bacterium]
MGLTIHYDLKYGGKEPAKVLEQLRQKAMDLPFAEVSPVVYHFKGKDADWQNHDRESDFAWPLIQATRYVEYGRYHIGVVPKEVYFFNTWPGDECEEANFGLAKYPATLTFYGRKIPTRFGNGWIWHSFCKTQYASNISREHFLRCHLSVCLLLKEAEKMDLLKRVHDEGKFWDKWDFDALVEEVFEWNEMVKSNVRQLKTWFGEDNVISPIKD